MKIILNNQITSSDILDFNDLSPGDVFIIVAPNDPKDKLPFPFSNIKQYNHYIFIFISNHDLPSGKCYSYLKYIPGKNTWTLQEKLEQGPYKVIKLDATLNIKGFL